MLTKKELVRLMAERSDLPQTVVEKSLNVLLDIYREQLAAGEAVVLGDLGRLQIKERAARAGRNPATGAAIEIPARKTVRFQPGKHLVEQLNPA